MSSIWMPSAPASDSLRLRFSFSGGGGTRRKESQMLIVINVQLADGADTGTVMKELDFQLKHRDICQFRNC